MNEGAREVRTIGGRKEKPTTKERAERLFRQFDDLLEITKSGFEEGRSSCVLGSKITKNGQEDAIPTWLVSRTQESDGETTYRFHRIPINELSDPEYADSLVKNYREGNIKWDLTLNANGNVQEVQIPTGRALKAGPKREVTFSRGEKMKARTLKKVEAKVDSYSMYDWYTEIPPDSLSRRVFLKKSLGLGASALLVGLGLSNIACGQTEQAQTKPKSSVSYEQKTAIGSDEDVPLTSEGHSQSTQIPESVEEVTPEPTETNIPEPTETNIPEPTENTVLEPVYPDLEWEIDGTKIPVYNLENPLKSIEQLEVFRERVCLGLKRSEVNPYKRGLEFLISKQAWDIWNNPDHPDHPMNGEEFIPFVHRHLQELNKILTISGLPEVSTHLKRVIIFDEQKEDGTPNDIMDSYAHRQSLGSRDVFGSWGEGTNYVPKNWAHENFDDSLLHELAHYLLYVHIHYNNYFNPRLENFLPEGGGKYWKLRAPDKLLDFEVLDSEVQPHGSYMLQEAHTKNNYPFFTETERLCIMRSIQESQAMLSKGDPNASSYDAIVDRIHEETFVRGEGIAPSYKFTIPDNFPTGESTKARLYESDAYSIEGGDNIGWQILEAPIQKWSLGPGAEKTITIEKELVAGGAKSVGTDEENKIAKLFMLEVESSGGEKKVYAFTTWHLVFWFMKAQYFKAISEGKEPLLGCYGESFEVNVDLPYENVDAAHGG